MNDKELNHLLCSELSETWELHYIDEPANSAYLKVSEIKIEGASIFSAHSRQEREVSLKEQTLEPTLNMYFSLQGECAAWGVNSKDRYTIRNNEHVMLFLPEFDGYYALCSPQVQSFGITLYEPFFRRLYTNDLDCLKRLWDKTTAGKAAELSEHPLPITPRQQSLINEMQHCVYTGHMKQLFMESKIIELFLLQAEQAELLNGQKPVKIERHHIDKLHAARQFVKQRMFEPLTLNGIARETGLNEFMLKKGFKELFGLTVFGYLNELKMNYARQMLLDSKCTIYEVAYTMGYNEPYNFSKAFKKHFGYSPGELKRKFVL